MELYQFPSNIGEQLLEVKSNQMQLDLHFIKRNHVPLITKCKTPLLTEQAAKDEQGRTNNQERHGYHTASERLSKKSFASVRQRDKHSANYLHIEVN